MSHIQRTEGDPWINDKTNPFIEEWKSWCRLCAKADAQYINVLSQRCQEFMLTNLNYNTFNIVSVIEEFFRVHIKEDEKLSPFVCTECYHVVASFVKFSENIKKVQQFYDELLHSEDKTRVDLLALYEKYGLSKEESLAGPPTHKAAVEEIFIADSPVTSAAHTSKFEVKNEKLSDELPTEVFIKELEKKDEFQDPFGEEDVRSRLQECPPAQEDDNSNGSEDFNMHMDTSEDETEVKNNAVNSESMESEDSSEISKESKYTCKICSQRFQRSGNYSVHMKKKHGIVICPQCNSTFESESSLRRHMKDHQQLFPCQHCDRKFQTKEYVAQHIKFVHEDERPFICEACGDAVRTKGQLKEHMLTHTDYSPFECKECGKCFKQKQRLKRHMQIHGDKHICTECGKQLSTRATLNSHLLVHSDKMPHKCDYCGRLFKRAKTLKNHLIAHTGLRPYSCDFCDKTFSTGPSCRFHKKTMHPVELAALEASGVKTYTKNIPNLDVLKAVSRTAENLTPLASKQNGYAIFDRKRDTPHEDVNSKPTEAVVIANDI